MIRLTPDPEGRFGFHVKGGRELNLPVFVSKVKGDSPVRDTTGVITDLSLSLSLSLSFSLRPHSVILLLKKVIRFYLLMGWQQKWLHTWK